MDKWGNYAKWNKLDTKLWLLHEFTYRRYVVKLIETESQMVIPRDWGEGENGELLFNGHRVSIWEDENSSGIRC